MPVDATLTGCFLSLSPRIVRVSLNLIKLVNTRSSGLARLATRVRLCITGLNIMVGANSDHPE